MLKRLIFLLSLLCSHTLYGEAEVSEKPFSFSDKTLICDLKAKAVQAGSFWGGTYFDTSVTSEKNKNLRIKVLISELKSGKPQKASAFLKIDDKSLSFSKSQTKETNALGYEISYDNKTRSVSSEGGEPLLPLKSVIFFGEQKFEKQFNMIPGHKAYVHFDVDDPSHFDLKVTNIFMICSVEK